MKILGLCYDVWMASAALIEDGKVIAAAPEERFTRIKREREFPKNAIDFCLKKAGCTLEDIDYIALGWNPGSHLKRYNPRYSKTIRWRAEYLYTVPNSIIQFSDDKIIKSIEENLILKNNKKLKIIYVGHHLSHAANAYFLSPFNEAAIFSSDGRGEDECGYYAHAKGNKIVDSIGTINFPHSIGLFYMTFTEYLGFQTHSDEWKVMALGAYVEKEENPYYEKIRKLIKVRDDGDLWVDLSYFDYYLQDQLNFFSKRFVKEMGEPRMREDKLEKRHYLIAGALQKVTEEILTECLNFLYNKTNSKNLVVNGGTFMNSLFNGKILQQTKFENLFISSCPDDSGTCIGAALYVYNDVMGEDAKRETQIHNFYGPEFSEEEIKKALEDYKLKYEYIENIEEYTSKEIEKGNIIGWFQGRMEFGQRALGNRSILADPRDPKMKDKINACIKYRESFRPFAPSILEENKDEYFEIEKDTYVPFMEKVYLIKEEKRKIIPAVTHADGTGRLQTVSKESNPRYYKLISEFGKRTGVPIILNTSFNLNGEPIVCSPKDAIRTFYSCGLDMLVIGNYVVKK